MFDYFDKCNLYNVNSSQLIWLLEVGQASNTWYRIQLSSKMAEKQKKKLEVVCSELFLGLDRVKVYLVFLCIP